MYALTEVGMYFLHNILYIVITSHHPVIVSLHSLICTYVLNILQLFIKSATMFINFLHNATFCERTMYINTDRFIQECEGGGLPILTHVPYISL